MKKTKIDLGPEQLQNVDPEQLQKKMLKLAQHLSDECRGQPVLAVQGACAHLLAQIIMLTSGDDSRLAEQRIDKLALAMKDDMRLIRERKTN